MKTMAAFFNNYRINHDVTNVAIVAKVKCERNVCENELRRLRDGLEKLAGKKSDDDFGIRRKSGRNRYGTSSRRWNKDRDDDIMHHQDDNSAFPSVSDSSVSLFPSPYSDRMKHDLRQNFSEFQTMIDPSHKSLLYRILEAKLLDCLHTRPKVNKKPSDSISLILSNDSESSSNTKTATPNTNPPLQKSTRKNKTLEVNDYEKSTLAVPGPKRSGSKKSKKKKNKRKNSNKKHRSSNRKRK